MEKDELIIYKQVLELFNENVANGCLKLWRIKYKSIGLNNLNIRNFVEEVFEMLKQQQDTARKLKLLSALNLEINKQNLVGYVPSTNSSSTESVNAAPLSKESQVFFIFLRQLYTILKRNNYYFAHQFALYALSQMLNKKQSDIKENVLDYFEKQLSSEKQWDKIPVILSALNEFNYKKINNVIYVFVIDEIGPTSTDKIYGQALKQAEEKNPLFDLSVKSIIY